MANNVRFFQYTQLPASADKYTFYLVGSESAGYDLYLGSKKLNNQAEIESAVAALNEELGKKALASDLTTLKNRVDSITAGEGGDSLATLRAALNSEIERSKGAEATLQDAIDVEKGRVDAANTKISTLEGKMSTAEGKISTLEGVIGNEASGLVKDVAALQTKDEALESKIDGEIARAKGVEEGLRTDVDSKVATATYEAGVQGLQSAINEKVATATYEAAIEGLQADIDEKALASDLEAEITRATKAEQEINAAIALLVDSTEGDGEKLNSIKELASWIETHGGEAEAMTSAIEANTSAIATEKSRAEGVESGLQTRIKSLEDMSHDFAGADATLKSELESQISGKVAQSAYDAKMSAIDLKHDGYDTKIAALEAKDTSLETAIENAKNAAISAAATDATSKANTAEANAKTHADTEIGKVDTKVTNLTSVVEGKVSQSDFNTLSGTVSTNSGEISTLKTNLSALQGSLNNYYNKTEIDDKFTAVNKSISGHGERLDNIDGSISALNTALTWQVVNQ